MAVVRMYTVYVLKSELIGRLYIGFTRDIKDRLMRHNSGKVKSIKAYKPYLIVYQEKVDNSLKAREREKYLKSGKGRAFIKSILG
ncbi:MAG: GIY-YIG nuclease family protein [bacterium]